MRHNHLTQSSCTKSFCMEGIVILILEMDSCVSDASDNQETQLLILHSGAGVWTQFSLHPKCVFLLYHINVQSKVRLKPIFPQIYYFFSISCFWKWNHNSPFHQRRKSGNSYLPSPITNISLFTLFIFFNFPLILSLITSTLENEEFHYLKLE